MLRLSIVVGICTSLFLVHGRALAQDVASTPPTDAVVAVRPALSVVEFETDRTAWMPPPRLGATLAELLTGRLLSSGEVRVIDPSVLADAGAAGGAPVSLSALRTRAAGAGVDYLVVGALTRLSIEKRSSSGGGILPFKFIGGAFVHKDKTEETVGLSIRVIDVRTGEILGMAVSEAGASDSHTSGGGFAIAFHLPIIGGTHSSATGQLDGMLATAAKQAIDAAAEQILAGAARLVR